MTPYFEDGSVALYLGDCREVVPALGLRADLIVTDPPYASTSLKWDRWPEGWVAVAESTTASMWCFGSLRMFLERAADFAGWTCSQDLVWEKHNGSGFHADRFRRVHEQAVHFYRGTWADTHHAAVYVPGATAKTMRSKRRPTHTGSIERTPYQSVDGGPKLATSIVRAHSMHGKALHPTEKPTAVLVPLIQYGAPLGGSSWIYSLGPGRRSMRLANVAGALSGSRPARNTSSVPRAACLRGSYSQHETVICGAASAAQIRYRRRVRSRVP